MRPTLTLIAILTLLGTFWGGYVWADCIQDPVSYWNLDQDTQPYVNEILDVSPGICTPPSCPVLDPLGTVANAQLFDGVDDVVTVERIDGAVFDIQGTDSFSVGVWFRRDADPMTWVQNEVLVGRYATRETHFWIGLQDQTGLATFRLWDDNIFGDRDAGVINGSTNIADGQWHFILAVRNAATNQNLLYVDGIQEGQLTITYSGAFTGQAPMTIGSMDGQYFFNGGIDEVYYFDEAVTPENATLIYNAGLAGNSICSGNQSPVITSSAPADATVGAEYRYEPTATDPDGDSLTWSMDSTINGITIDETTGVITWTPTAGTTTSGQITLMVSDGINSDEEVFTITVNSDDGGSSGGSSGGDDGGGGDSSSGGGCFIVASSQNGATAWLKIPGALAFLTLILFAGVLLNRKRC